MVDQDMIKRAGEAIAKAGSPEFVGNSGATQKLLSELAGEGQLEAMSTVFIAHVAIHRADRRRLLHVVPTMVSNQYFCGHRKVLGIKVAHWCNDNPGWDTALRNALDDPARFGFVALAMADEIDRAGDA